MKIIEGERYSSTQFEGYNNRIQMRFLIGDNDYDSNVDIYTTDTDKDHTAKVIKENLNPTVKVKSVKVTNWSSKEQDDRCSAMIDEWLNKEIK